MKVLGIIGIVLLSLLVIGGIGYGAYVLGTNQSSTVINNNTDNSGNNNASNNVQPKVVTEPTCNADELTLVLGQGNGAAAGSRSISLVFSNTGSRECALAGFPGLSLVNDNGNQIGAAADRSSSTGEKTVTLQPNQSASALVVYPVESNFDAGTCQDGATKLRVYPPNDYGYLSIVSPITGRCPGFQVGPVTAE